MKLAAESKAHISFHRQASGPLIKTRTIARTKQHVSIFSVHKDKKCYVFGGEKMEFIMYSTYKSTID